MKDNKTALIEIEMKNRLKNEYLGEILKREEAKRKQVSSI